MLKLLAASADGSNEALLLAHGFALQVIVGVREGLATVAADRMLAGGSTVGVTRVKITDAGRRTLL